MHTPLDTTSSPSPRQTRHRPFTRRNAVAASVVLAAMIVAAAALTLGRSSPRHAAATVETPAADVRSGNVAVSITNFAFDPPNLTVKAGTTVTWTNLDTEEHTVRTTKSPVVRSEVLATNAAFSFTFTDAGEYAYHCSIHPEMHGTVVVVN